MTISIQYINTGTSANKGNGDTLRSAFMKINENFRTVSSSTLFDGSYSNLSNIPQDISVAARPTFSNLTLNGLNLTLANTSTSASASNGAGIYVVGPATTASILYASSNDSWNINKTLNVTALLVNGQAVSPSGLGNITITDNIIGTVNTDENLVLNPNGNGRVNLASSALQFDNGNNNIYRGHLLYTAPNSGLVGLGIDDNNASLRIVGDAVTLGTLVDFGMYDGVSSAWNSRVSIDSTGTLFVNNTNTVYIGGNALTVESDNLLVNGNVISGSGGATNQLTSGTYAVVLNDSGILAVNTLTSVNTIYQGTAYDGIEYSDTSFRADSDTNSFAQMIIKNHNPGENASTDIIIMNDQGTELTNFLDIGINSSGYAQPAYGVTGPGDGYVYTNGGDLCLGTQTPGTRMTFHAGGTEESDAGGWLDQYGWTLNRRVELIASTPSPLRFKVLNQSNNSAAQSLFAAVNDQDREFHLGINSSNTSSQYGNIGPGEAFIHVEDQPVTLHIGSYGDLKFYADQTHGYDGTPTITVSKVDQSVTFTGDILPNQNKQYDLGSPTYQWRSLYVGTATIYIDNIPLSINASNNTVIVGPQEGQSVLASEDFVNVAISGIPTGPKGDQGVQGNTGTQGIQGPIGPQGIQGNTGTVGIQGPIGNTGTQGIQGPIGDTGAQGINIVLVGSSATTTVESLGAGSAGQGWINTTDGDVYFWNTLTTLWENIGPIVGPQGERGLQGVQGEKGDQGIQGSKGDTGAQGNTGTQGLQGPEGPQGIQGIQGNTGTQGLIGPTGPKGDRGDVGLTGATGAQGATGPQGEPGADALWNWLGTYSASPQYQEGDIVTYQGSTYRRNNYSNSAMGYAPPNNTYWEVVAQKGADGTGGSGNTGTIWTNDANGCLRAELSATGFEAFTEESHVDLQNSGVWSIGSYGNSTFIGNNEFDNLNDLSLRSGDATFITTNLRENGNHQWKFGTDGVITLPSGNTRIGNVFGTDAIVGNTGTSVGVLVQGQGGAGGVQWVDNPDNIGSSGTQIAAVVVNSPLASSTGTVQIVTGVSTTSTIGSNTWEFGADGNLTIPDDIQDANGSVIRVATTSTSPTRVDGQLWFNSEEGRMYVKYNGQWIDASPAVVPAPGTYLQDITIDGSTLNINGGTLTIDDTGTLLVNGSEVTGSETGSSTHIEYTDGQSGYTSTVDLGYNFEVDVDDAHLNLNGVGTWSIGSNNFDTKIFSTEDPGNDPTVIVVRAGDEDWTFGPLGWFTLPGGSVIKDGMGAIRLEPTGASSSTQALLIYPTAIDGNHIHLTAGGGETDLYLGSDIQYVKVDHGGSIVIGAVGANTSTWTFGTNGILTLPAATPVIKGGGTGTDVTIVAANTNTTSTWVFGADGGLTFPQGITLGDYPGVGPAANTIALSGAQVYLSSTDGSNWVGVENGVPSIGASESIVLSTNNAGSPFNWTFSSTGTLQIPSAGSITFPDNTVQTTAFTGTVAYSNITDVPLVSTSTLVSGTYTVTLSVTGQLNLPSAANNESSNARIQSANSIDVLSNLSKWTFDTDGGLTLPDGGTLRMSTAPTSSTGAVGDKAGTIAVNSASIFYCIADYYLDTGTYYVTTTNSNDGSVFFIEIAKGSYPQPQIGWGVSIGGNITQIDGATTDLGSSWRISVGAVTAYSTGTSVTLTNPSPSQSNIWVKQAWGTTGSW